MNIGVINESAKIENRVGLSPSGVSFLLEKAHAVYVQAGAGLRSGYSNEDYAAQGAHIVFTEEEVFGRSDIVINISPLNREECRLVKPHQVLLGFHHLAIAKKPIVEELLQKNVTMIGYEIIQDDDDALPFYENLGEVAGPLCLSIAGHYLQTNQGGRGMILGGVVSVAPATVVIIGSGVLARSATRAMLGAGAQTIVIGHSMERMRRIEEMTGGHAITLMGTKYNLARITKVADILIGAVLHPGERAPIMITREMVKTMKKGSVIIDLAIDHGGCIETSRPTTLEHPTFLDEGIIHYCVPNITSSVSRTSTKVLSNLAVQYLHIIGQFGIDQAIQKSRPLGRGLYMHKGYISKKNIAERFHLSDKEPALD
ncbi:MAG: alanine dehydrogenase [Candidatus Aminicenantes bacterium]|nr:alanine dehydrogenase [Candidatus Aminicenantes bacterium]